MTVLYCVDPALVRVWHVPFSDVTSKTASECLDSAKSGCPLMVAVIDARTVPVNYPSLRGHIFYGDAFRRFNIRQ